MSLFKKSLEMVFIYPIKTLLALLSLTSVLFFIYKVSDTLKTWPLILGYVKDLPKTKDFIAGNFAILGILVITSSFFVGLYNFLIIKNVFSLRLILSVKKGIKNIKVWINKSVSISQPKLCSYTNKSGWLKLASAAIDGFSNEEVIQSHHYKVRVSCPVIFCSYQAYAKAVSQVLKELQKFPTRDLIDIYTLFNKSIFYWYNPFPISDGCYASLKWWEDYKQTVADYESVLNEGTTLHRLVIHSESYQDHMDVSKYFIIGNEGKLIDECRNAKNGYELHQSINKIDEEEIYNYKKAYIHLIAKNENESAKQEYLTVEKHFKQHYHSSDQTILKYLKNTSHLESLINYDDVFIVHNNTRKYAFGLAYIADKFRDLNGLRFITQEELMHTKTMGINTILTDFQAILSNSDAISDDFIACKS